MKKLKIVNLPKKLNLLNNKNTINFHQLSRIRKLLNYYVFFLRSTKHKRPTLDFFKLALITKLDYILFSWT